MTRTEDLSITRIDAGWYLVRAPSGMTYEIESIARQHESRHLRGWKIYETTPCEANSEARKRAIAHGASGAIWDRVATIERGDWIQTEDTLLNAKRLIVQLNDEGSARF